MALTTTDVRNAKPLGRPYKLSDEKGLYLWVEPDGQATWKFAYTFNQRDKVVTLGDAATLSLADARELREQARELIADGTDPLTVSQKRAVSQPSVATFEAVAEDWLERVYRFEVSEAQFRRTKRQLENYILSNIGKRLVTEVTPEDLKTLANALGAQGHIDTGKRVLGITKRVYQHARDTGVAGYQQSGAIKRRLTSSGTPPEFQVSTREQLTKLASNFLGFWGRTSTTAAMKLTVWVLARPSDIVNARWSDMDLDSGEWRIRRKNQNGERIVTVPLPRQAVELLREMEPLTGRYEYIFPGTRDKKKPLGSNAIRGALKKVTKPQKINTDKLRTLAAVALGELGYQAEQIQSQLIEQTGDKDNDDQAHLQKRREMLQDWADYLDGSLIGKAVKRL